MQKSFASVIQGQQGRADGYVSSPNSFIQQQPNQGGNQGPGLRAGMGPTGPPNQASTPPNTDLKVQNIPQPSSMQYSRHTQNFYNRATAGPPSQGVRMPSQHNRTPQPVYQQQGNYVPMVPHQMYIYSGPYTGQRQSNLIPNFVHHVPQFPPSFQHTYNTAPPSNPPAYYNFPLMRAPPPQAAAVPPNPTQPPIPNMAVMPQGAAPHQPPPAQRQQNKRRPNAICIINPTTGIDLLSEVYGDKGPTSGESSARQTPQPAAAQPPAKETPQADPVVVAAAALDPAASPVDYHHQVPHGIPPGAAGSIHYLPPVHHGGPPPPAVHQQPPPLLHHPQQQQQQQHVMLPPQQPHVQHHQEVVDLGQEDPIDPTHYPVPHGSHPPSLGDGPPNRDLASTSKLKAQAKEFVSVSKPQVPAVKETPVVSANCDAAEVTIAPKQKDRESPAKSGQGGGGSGGHKEKYSRFRRNKEESAAPVAAVTESSVEEVVQVVQPEVVQPVVEPPKEEVVDSGASKKEESVVKVEVPVVHHQPDNAKSKQNNTAKVQQQQQQQQPSNKQQQSQNQKNNAPPPASIPAPKLNNKGNKKNDLNLKGASKEGTDMDSISDTTTITPTPAIIPTPAATATILQNEDALNANVMKATDIINSNSMITNETPVAAAPAPVDNVKPNATEASNEEPPKKPAENNDNAAPAAVTAAPPPVVAAPEKTVARKTTKFDVTSLIKDEPPQARTKPAAAAAPPVNDDAGDRMVQAKNDFNAKEGSSSNASSHPDLKYEDGQWSPYNQDGNKVYKKDFLMGLKDVPLSKQKPDNYMDIVSAVEGGSGRGGRMPDNNRYASMGGGRSDSNFKSGSRGGAGGKNSSQTGDRGDRGGGGNKMNSMSKNKSNKVSISLSLREDVKLSVAENAWKPNCLGSGGGGAAANKAGADDAGSRTAEDLLYKRIRGVLNRLTPEKLEPLCAQVLEMQFETQARMKGVIDIVFEKAIDEPKFSVEYATLCERLSKVQVPADKTPNAKDQPEFVNFRKVLLTRCQNEFDKESVDETKRNLILKELNDVTDPEKKKDVQFELEEYDRRVRMKSVGNIRFIGELFKQNMLTVAIMKRCLDKLLTNGDEESLECLCKLLTTIGKELESEKNHLDLIFKNMRLITERRQDKVSSRVKFMLQDVIDLRTCKWVPRGQDLNPKTMDQIDKEAAAELMNSNALINMPSSRKEEQQRGGGGGSMGGGGGGGGSSDRKRGKNVMMDDGWMSSNTSRSNRTFSVQSDKLKSKPPRTDELSLGSGTMFNTWSKGSAVKSSGPSSITSSSNMFSALDRMNENDNYQDKKSGGGGGGGGRRGGPYHSKGPSIERNSSSRGGDSRSGSLNRFANDGPYQRNSSGRVEIQSTGASLQQQQQQQQQSKPVVSKPAAAAAPSGPTEILSEEKLERRFKTNLEEYVNDITGVAEFDQEIKSCAPASYVPRLITDCFYGVLEKSKAARVKTSTLFARLIQLDTVSLDQFLPIVEDVLSMVDDLVIDIPMICQCLAEMLVSLVCEEVLPLGRLHKMVSALKPDQQCTLMGTLLQLAAHTKGQDFVTNIWRISELQLAGVVAGGDAASIDKFTKDYNLEFLKGGGQPGQAAGQSAAGGAGAGEFTFEQIQNKLTSFFVEKAQHDDITDWTLRHVGERTKDRRFIRALVTALFKYSIKKNALVAEAFHGHSKLLFKYMDSTPEYELHCLYAVQQLVHEMEHPQGLLLAICNTLYEAYVVSHESFTAWANSTDPAEVDGKAVALAQLKGFLQQIQEDDESLSED